MQEGVGVPEASIKCLAEHLPLTGPPEFHQVPKGMDAVQQRVLPGQRMPWPWSRAS